MKASVSSPPDSREPRRGSGGATRQFIGLTVWAWLVGVIATVYAVAHLPFLAPSLEDIDSINFALGLRDFNPALHQPHPPGYPIYIALGRLSLAAISRLTSLPPVEAETLALAVWSALAGAVAIVAAGRLFAAIELDGRPRRDEPRARPPIPSSDHFPAASVWGVALLAATPLFWMCGLRPMSDMPGLAVALAAQALLVEGRGDSRRLTQGALVAGLAAGIRIQTLPLTIPLLVLALWSQARQKGLARAIVAPAAAMVVAVLAWGVPLILASGGIDAYLRALGTQAGEDFAWVDMLWANPTPRRLAMAVYETFVLPWAALPLAVVVGVAATCGAVAAVMRARRALALMLVAFVPYVVYHLLLQETVTVRYALPAVPLVVWLAVHGLQQARRWMPIIAVPIVGSALAVAVTGGVAYSSEAHPAFRAIGDATRRAASQPPGATYAHYSIRRPLQVVNATVLHFVEPRRQYEWLGLFEYWRDGGSGPIWFLADPLRTDVALIDPRGRRDVVRYRWPAASRPELSGTRPLGVDWYRLLSPGWIAGAGWSLTPETGGLVQATGAGPDRRPIEALVRRRPGPLHLVVGGRHLGIAGDPDAEFELAIDGRLVDRWRLSVGERNFLRFVDLPGMASGPGRYARLVIVSHAAERNGRPAEVAVRQFDIQSADELIVGFGEGWHEEEYAADSGRSWRWTSEQSVLRVQGPARTLRVTLRGESPLKYLGAAPSVRILAGGKTIGEFHPDADFEWSVDVPADAWRASGGAVTIATTPVYLPGQAEGTADERHLGLRLYETRVTAVGPLIDSR